MASIKRLMIYSDIQAGKRLVSVPAADLRAVKMWLFRNGYRWKTNINGEVTNILIERK